MIFSESQTFPEDDCPVHLCKGPVGKEDFASESVVYYYHLDKIS